MAASEMDRLAVREKDAIFDHYLLVVIMSGLIGWPGQQ